MHEDTRPMKSFLKPSDASTLFRVPLGTIYTWYRLGQVDGVKLSGKVLRIHAGSLVDFLRSRRVLDRHDVRR